MSMYLSPNRPSHINHDDLDGPTRIQAVAGRFSAIQPTLIEKQRQMEKKQEQLRRQFQQIDVNQDGRLGIEEVMNFLDQKSGGEFDRQIVDHLFKRLDQDVDGAITLDQFVEAFLDTEENLRVRITETIKSMTEHTKQRDDIRNKITQAKIEEKTTQYGIMEGSILTVNCIEARDLPKDNEIFVIFMIQNQQLESMSKKKTNYPVWNESMSFDIYNGQQPLIVRVMNRERISDELIGQFAISLDGLKNQMKKQEWYPILKDNQENGKIRLICQWIHSKVLFLTDVLERWDATIAQDAEDKQRLQNLMIQLRKPFGFLNPDTTRQVSRHLDPIQENERKLVLPPTKQVVVEVQKAIFESGVSKVMNSMIGRFGIKDSIWWKLLFYTLIIYMLLTCLVMFYRTDFINLTFSTASFFMIVYGQFKKRKVYTALLYTSIVTLILDIVWLIIFSGDWNGDIPTDGGGIEKGIRRFSLFISYINFFFRLIVIIGLWKVSYDFEKISQSNPSIVVGGADQGQSRHVIRQGHNGQAGSQDNRFGNLSADGRKPSNLNPFEDV